MFNSEIVSKSLQRIGSYPAISDHDNDGLKIDLCNIYFSNKP